MRLVEPERRIQLVSEISEEAYKKFSKKLYALEIINDSDVVIELNSPGGDAVSALAFASRIRLSPCDVHIVAYGQVASAAVLLLAYGTTRAMAKESWVMVHEDSAKLTGEVVALERETKQLRNLEDQWAQLLEETTGTKAATWTKLHKATTYLSAKECLKLGLIDKVI